MTRSRHATGAALIVLLGGCAPPAARPPGQPNVLVIVVDCLRADRVLAGASERVAAPNLQEFAREGTLFRQTYAQASWTRASVPTLLTGLYPSEHGLGLFEGSTPGAVRAQKMPPSVTTLAEAMRASGYATMLVAYQAQLARQFGLDQGFDLYANGAGGALSINRRFAIWFDELRARRPLFAYVHYLDIHWPLCSPPRVRHLFSSGASEIDFCAHWRALDRDIRSGKVVLGDADHQAMRDYYDEKLLEVDQRIGELFDRLKQRGEWDNTLVLVTADHGEEFHEHGDYGHGRTLYDEVTRIPLIVKPPRSWGAPRGAVVDGLVESRDLIPTILDAAGARLEPPLAGAVSLLPWIVGRPPADSPHRFVASELTGKVAIRTPDRKLIVDLGGGAAQLFDLAQDPAETLDLASARPAEVASLMRYFGEWRRRLRPVAVETLDALDPETEQQLRALGYIN